MGFAAELVRAKWFGQDARDGRGREDMVASSSGPVGGTYVIDRAVRPFPGCSDPGPARPSPRIVPFLLLFLLLRDICSLVDTAGG